MVPGTEIALGDRTFVLPPLNLALIRNGGLGATLKRIDELIEGASPAGAFELLESQAQVILACLRRNYSADELSDDDFVDRLDVLNVRAAWSAVLGLSFPPPGPARPEVPPMPNDGTSTESTQTSLGPTGGTTESSTN